MSDSTVRIAYLVNDVTILAADWSPYQLPVLLSRNLTVAGAYEEQLQWPTLDLNFVRGLVQLGHGVTLTFTRLVAVRGRIYPIFQAPGIDLLAYNNTGNASVVVDDVQVPILLATNVSMVFRVCLPASMNAASVTGLPRPASIPGNNTAVRLPPWPGCINSSSAPPLKRCWPGMGRQDVAFYARDLDPYGKFSYAGYIVVLGDILFMCEKVMSEECIAQFGTVGCYYRITAAAPVGGNGSQPPPSGIGSSGAAVSKRGVVIAPLAGGVAVGGLILVMAAMSLGREALRWRRRRTDASCDDAAAAGGSCCPSSCPVLADASGVDGPWRDATCVPTANGAILMADSQHRAGALERCGSGAAEGPSGRCMTGDASVGHQSIWASPLGNRTSTRASTAEHELVPVTPLTPLSCDVDLGVLVSTAPEDPQGPDGGDRGGEASVQLLKTTLGKGASGRVVLGMYRGARVAVKLLNTGLPDHVGLPDHACMLNTASVDGAGGAGEGAGARPGSTAASGLGPEAAGAAGAAARTLAQEVEVLARCQHPNVIRLLAASLQPPRVCLVMELMDTSLERLLYGRPDGRSAAPLPLPTVLHIAVQMACALSYLHPTVLHRDLKPANVLISSPDSTHPEVKVADFGLSRIQNTVVVTQNPEVGTAPYMPPEAFNVHNVTITDRGDVYAFGVILWEMLAQRRPWEGMSIVQIAFAVTIQQRRLPFELLAVARCPPKLRSLIESCWDPVPQRRPAAAEVAKSLILVQEAISRADLNCPGLEASLRCPEPSPVGACRILKGRSPHGRAS